MVHLDELATDVGEDSPDWDPLYASLRDTSVSRLFQQMGYRYVHVGSWWGPTAFDPAADENHTYGVVREFPQTFLETTIVPSILTRLPFGPDDPYETDHARTLFQFETVEDVARDPAPTFTFAHFLLPHPPYVFAADGTYRPQGDPTSIDQKYLDQLSFTNERIQAMLDVLLSVPRDDRPIVVLQSDEGPYPPEFDTGLEVHFDWKDEDDVELGRRLRILDALYLPDVPDRQTLLQPISPVNTFRYVFDRYFGTHLPMLPDRTFVFEDVGHPYRFLDVTDRLRT